MFKISKIIVLVTLTIVFPNKESIQAEEVVDNETFVNEKQYPFMVALTYPSHKVGCAGSLVAVLKVLTSAHCKKTEGEEQLMYVVAGDTDLYSTLEKPNKQVRKIIKFFRHPKYIKNDGSTSYPHDLGMITVDSEFDITEYVAMVPIAPSSTLLKNGSLVIAAGFGAFGYAAAFPSNGSVANKDFLDGKARFGTFRIAGNNLKYSETSVPMYQSTFAYDSKTKYLGDSGGPVFDVEDDLPILYAISSYINGPDLMMDVMITHRTNRNWVMLHAKQVMISNAMAKLEVMRHGKFRSSGQLSILDRGNGYSAFKIYFIVFFTYCAT